MFRWKVLLVGLVVLWTFIFYAPASITYNYHWETTEEIQGADQATQVAPVKVLFLDEPIQVVSYSTSLRLMQKYSVYLGTEWSPVRAYQLLQTFESIPQPANNFYEESATVPYSLWKLTKRHIQDDIAVDIKNGQKIVTISEETFTYVDARLAEIEGVRGRFFSRRLHHAVVRFVTDGGRDRFALEDILNERYGISLNVPDYSELTQSTTGEHAGRFTTFKNEEVMALVNMLEEFPQGMHKTQGLKYLIRRLDGTPHPLYPAAPAVAWTGAGYIEFMESAFQGQGADYIHRLILHEKTHFLWAHLFDEQLKQDWIQLGGWYENPDDTDGWSTTKQTEFVSAYAHGKNPNEDMAESISFYIVNPDKLRSRSPAKYQFIQDRIMHGTRYISRIREDLTFEVYNLYPDVVYPGRIIRVDIQVNGEPEADKAIVIELEIHRTGDFDTAQASHVRVFSSQGTFFDLWLYPIGPSGERRVNAAHILRGQTTLSRYAANGYWGPDAITLRDAQGNERHQSQTDFGWKLYIDNSLADNEAPVYIRNSMRLSLSDSMEDGRSLQILTARWQIFEENEVKGVYAQLNDENSETYSRRTEDWGEYNPQNGEATVKLKIPDYYQSGTYTLNYIRMEDAGLNSRGVYFTDPGHALRDEQEIVDEEPATIEIQTTNPDSTPPVLDLNRITVKAEPTKPEAPDGETAVDINFRIKDDISGYSKTNIYLRDPHGVEHFFRHYHPEFHDPYFSGDPTVYQDYHKTIILPVGSIPGTWGVAEMTVLDKAQNPLRVDFTEIVRFEIAPATEVPITPTASTVGSDVEYLWSIPAGISLTHVPLKVKAVDGVAETIGSVADLYDALGGTSVVNFLITYDPQTQEWRSYFVPSDKDGTADATLTDDKGVIAGLRTPVSVRLRGGALGTNETSTITLNQGLNLVGLPLNDSRIMRVSDLFALEGIGGNVPVIILTDNGEFKAVGRAGDPGDIEITGGQAFILTAQQTATVTLSGEAWTNTSGTAAAPPLALTGIEVRDMTPVLALKGAVVDEETGLNKPGFRATVKNLSNGRAVTGMTKDEGVGYQLTIVDIETGRAATIGDTLEISAQSPNPFIGVEPLRYTVTAEDVKRSLIQLPELVVYQIPAKTQLLHNYPNPFNPETWIPYRLAGDAFVTLTIYDQTGHVVRTLDVGHRIASVYESRSKAIHWDGRNELGERVASGIYFYNLSAGNYSITRRMVILK